MSNPLRRALERIRAATRNKQTSLSPPLGGGFPDIDWLMRVENAVLQDTRRSVDALTRSYPFGLDLQVEELLFDAARGSLRLRPQERPEIVLAVEDALAAENLAAAFDLGGLRVSLARAGLGTVMVEGVWEGRVYRLYGIPALNSAT